MQKKMHVPITRYPKLNFEKHNRHINCSLMEKVLI